MVIEKKGKDVSITECADFDPQLIFECGQAFRWRADREGAYWGVAYGKPVCVSRKQDVLSLHCCDEEDFDQIWRGYFDLGQDYEAIRKRLACDPRLIEAIAFGTGIRILRQEPWETLCSFLISQCNHIPRIRKIIETMCQCFGDVRIFGDQVFYTFPGPDRIAALEEADLAPLRAGYRAKYLLSAAQALCGGRLSLEMLSHLPTQQAREELMKLPGIGRKVADCILLYGFGRLEVYPVDVWMRRAGSTFFSGEQFDGACFGAYAGVAQQYVFHYIRSIQKKTNA